MKVTDLHKYGTHAEVKRILRQPHHRYANAETASLTLAHNTYADHSSLSDCIHVTYHRTRIATLYPDGSVCVTSGGWRTPTTKIRLNAFLPPMFTLYADKGTWKVLVRRNIVLSDGVTTGTTYKDVLWEDGMSFFPDGTVVTKDQGRFDPHAT